MKQEGWGKKVKEKGEGQSMGKWEQGRELVITKVYFNLFIISDFPLNLSFSIFVNLK